MQKPTKRQRIRTLVIAATGLGAFVAIAACTPSDSALSNSQNITNEYTNAAQSKVPYPLDEMKSGGWTERKLLRENLLRQNDPNAIHYVVLMSNQGQVLANWTIKGMVFDPNSQMTNAQTIGWNVNNANYANGVLDSAGDNGTWGPEAFCYAFFTTSNNEIKLPCNGGIPIESDTPLNFVDKPLITYNVTDKPSVDKGGLAGIGGH